MNEPTWKKMEKHPLACNGDEIMENNAFDDAMERNPDMEWAKLGKAMHRMRIAARIHIYEAAKIIHIDVIRLSSFEHGRERMHLDNIRELNRIYMNKIVDRYKNGGGSVDQ